MNRPMPRYRGPTTILPAVVRIRRRHLGEPRDGSGIAAAFLWATGDRPGDRCEVGEFSVRFVACDPAAPGGEVAEKARLTDWLMRTWWAPYWDGDPVDPITLYRDIDYGGWYYHLGGLEDDPRA